VISIWEDRVRSGLVGIARALFTATSIDSVHTTDTGVSIAMRAPSEVHASKCEPHRGAVEAALGAALGTTVNLTMAAGAVSAPATAAPTPPPIADDEVDLSELVDAPPEAQRTPEQDVADLFPGSRVMESGD
jgi:hypothetical protein